MQIKRITALLLTAILAVSLAACGNSQTADKPSDSTDQQTEVSENTENHTTDMQTDDQTIQETANDDGQKSTLILYFSADNTKDVDAVSSATPMADGTASVEWIANIIQAQVGGDLIPIIPSVDYPLDYDELADYAKQERDDGGRPAFEDLGVDPTSYDIVFIGYPIWWYEMPMIMDTFFDTYDFTGVTIIPFNTHAGSRDGGTYGDISELEPNATVLDGLAIRGEDAGEDSARRSIEEWLSGLNLD